MDFLRLGGDYAISLAQNGAGFAEAVSVLGLSVGSGTVCGWRAGVNCKYLDPATGPVVDRATFDIGRAAFLQNVGAAREIQFRRITRVVFACGIRDCERARCFVTDNNFRMKDFCQGLNSGD